MLSEASYEQGPPVAAAIIGVPHIGHRLPRATDQPCSKRLSRFCSDVAFAVLAASSHRLCSVHRGCRWRPILQLHLLSTPQVNILLIVFVQTGRADSRYRLHQAPPPEGLTGNLKAWHHAAGLRTRPPKAKETDPRRLETRQKQISFGKNTIGYSEYRKAVPK